MFESESLTLRYVLQVGAAVLLVLGMLFYVTFQARHVLIGPEISLSEEPAVHTNDRQIYLNGSTNNISRLWLNDRPIYTDPQGNFKEALILETGYTVATLRAEDRYGRTTTLEREYVYMPASFIE